MRTASMVQSEERHFLPYHPSFLLRDSFYTVIRENNCSSRTVTTRSMGIPMDHKRISPYADNAADQPDHTDTESKNPKHLRNSERCIIRIAMPLFSNVTHRTHSQILLSESALAYEKSKELLLGALTSMSQFLLWRTADDVPSVSDSDSSACI